MGKFLNALKIAILSGLAGLVLLLIAAGLHIGGWRALSVQTGSMRPAINPGDMVLVKRVPISALKNGDVITYINPKNKKQTITHRIVSVKKQSPQLIVKGDANDSPDPVVFIHQIIGKQKYRVPFAGYLMNFLRTWQGLTIFLYLPALFIIVSEIKRLTVYYKSQQRYVIAGRSFNYGNSVSPAKILPLILIMPLFLIVKTYALLQSTATLTGNIISSAAITNPNPCNTSGNSTTITVTGSGSGNVNVSNSNNQNAQTGNASSSNGGSATSGNATNCNSTNINISVTH